MSDKIRDMYVSDITGSAVTLSPDARVTAIQPPGTGIARVVVTTSETTPDASFWATAASCGRFRIRFQKVS